MAIFCHKILTDGSKSLHVLVTTACESQDLMFLVIHIGSYSIRFLTLN